MSIQEWLQISIRTKGRSFNHRYLDELKDIEDFEQWTAILFARLDEAVNMRDVLSADLVIQLMVLLECGDTYRGVTFSDVEGIKRETMWRQPPTLFARPPELEDAAIILGRCKLITLKNVPEDTATMYIEHWDDSDVKYWRAIFFIKKKDLARLQSVWPNILQ
jgi:hypothetical protein